MREAAVPQGGLRIDEFNAYLTDWLGASYDKTLAEGSHYKQNFLTVTIGGIECGLSGDTTRQGVTKYLIAYETSDPVFIVVANQKGVFNRVVLGHGGEPYLYTKEPQEDSTLLEEAPQWPVAPSWEDRGTTSPVPWGLESMIRIMLTELSPHGLVDMTLSMDRGALPSSQATAMEGDLAGTTCDQPPMVISRSGLDNVSARRFDRLRVEVDVPRAPEAGAPPRGVALSRYGLSVGERHGKVRPSG